MQQSESFKEISMAFVAAQTKIEGATKDRTNPHFGSAYADLSSVMDACKSALNENGIAVLQTTAEAKGPEYIAIDTTLLHRSGEWMRCHTEIPMGSRRDPQAFGSALTYARRYALAAMVGVCPEDDDGEAAADRSGTGTPAKKAGPSKQENQSKQPPKVETAHHEEIEELKALIIEAKIDGTIIKKWLGAATVKAKQPINSIDAMPADLVAKCIKYCQDKLPATSAA